MTNTDLTGALTRLRACLAAVHLPLVLAEAAEQTQRTHAMIAQLDDYILPRLANLEAPLLAVVGGSTGAGKSTLVNSLLRRPVSAAGVIRPTTRSPVLVVNPAEQRWFEDTRVLPGLARTGASSADTRALQLIVEPSLPPGMALLDAPDIDSVVDENRRLAAELLQAADLWLFITSATRYADAVPWQFLQSAARRGAAVAVVLDRISPAAMDVVPADLGRMMSQRGLADSPLFAVPETITDADGLLPDAAVAPIRAYLARLAADKQSRQQVVLQTLDGAIAALARDIPQIADAVLAQVQTAEQLTSDASASYAQAARSVAMQSADGTLLRGEVLSRWHDFVGTGEFARALDRRVSALRDRLIGAFRGGPPEGEQAAVAAQAGLEALVREEGEAAAERAAVAWNASSAGRQLMISHPELARPSTDYPMQVSRLIRDWQSAVLELVAKEGRGRRQSARVAALGVNGVGAALMLLIFANTGGLTGAEVGIAGGTSVLAQRVLESIFGDEAVRRLAQEAKADLDARVEGLMAGELVRFTRLIDELQLELEQVDELRAAAQAVDDERAAIARPARAQSVLMAVEEEVRQIESAPAPQPVRLDRCEDPTAEIVDAEILDEAHARQEQ